MGAPGIFAKVYLKDIVVHSSTKRCHNRRWVKSNNWETSSLKLMMSYLVNSIIVNLKIIIEVVMVSLTNMITHLWLIKNNIRETQPLKGWIIFNYFKIRTIKFFESENSYMHINNMSKNEHKPKTTQFLRKGNLGLPKDLRSIKLFNIKGGPQTKGLGLNWLTGNRESIILSIKGRDLVHKKKNSNSKSLIQIIANLNNLISAYKSIYPKSDIDLKKLIYIQQELLNGKYKFTSISKSNLNSQIIIKAIEQVLNSYFDSLFSKDLNVQTAICKLNTSFKNVKWIIDADFIKTIINNNNYNKGIQIRMNMLKKHINCIKTLKLIESLLNAGFENNLLFLNIYLNELDNFIYNLKNNYLNTKIHYIRYNNFFIIGIEGRINTVKEIYTLLNDFLLNNFNLILNKSKIKDFNKDYINFLGFLIKNQENKINIYFNYKKVINKLIIDGFARWRPDKNNHGSKMIVRGTFKGNLINLEVQEIIAYYNSIRRNFYKTYKICKNRKNLSYILWILEESFVLTLARKWNLDSMKKVYDKLGSKLVYTKTINNKKISWSLKIS